VRHFTYQAQRYVVKYKQTAAPRYLRSWMASAACAFMFNEWVRPVRLRAGGLGHEAARLHALRKQGLRVPRLVLQTPDFLVMEYCGEDLAQRIKRSQGAERAALLGRVVDELAEFHRAGHWHGGAQLRNLTWHQGQIYRIDFEETAGLSISLELAQAYDILLAFHSLIDYLDGDIALGVALLDRYFQRAPSAKADSALRRLERKVGWWTKLEPLLGGSIRKHKDIRRAFILTRVLQRR